MTAPVSLPEDQWAVILATSTRDQIHVALYVHGCADKPLRTGGSGTNKCALGEFSSITAAEENRRDMKSIRSPLGTQGPYRVLLV